MWPKTKAVAIVASGPSAALIPPSLWNAKGVTIIAVNGAIEWCGRADFWFSLDPSPVNMVRANNPRPFTRYVMAIPPNIPTPPHVWRINRLEGTAYGRARAIEGLSEEPDAIHTGNSGYGALGVAYHMRPERIGIFGVDADGGRRVCGGFSRNLSHVPPLFGSAARQLHEAAIEVRIGSETTKVRAFRRDHPRRVAEWLEGRRK